MLLKSTKATTNKVNSMIEIHQSKKSLTEMEMLCLTFSLILFSGCTSGWEPKLFFHQNVSHNRVSEDFPWSKIPKEPDQCWPFLLEFNKFCIFSRSQFIFFWAQMVHRTNSWSKISKPTEFHLHLEISAMKLAVSVWVYQTYIIYYCWRGFLEALEKLLDL